MLPFRANWWGVSTPWLTLVDDLLENIPPVQAKTSAFLYTGSQGSWMRHNALWDVRSRCGRTALWDVLNDAEGGQDYGLPYLLTPAPCYNYYSSRDGCDKAFSRVSSAQDGYWRNGSNKVISQNVYVMGNSCCMSSTRTSCWKTKWRPSASPTKWRSAASPTRWRAPASPQRERTRLYEMHKTGEEWMESFMGACGGDAASIRVESGDTIQSMQSTSTENNDSINPQNASSSPAPKEKAGTKKVKNRNSRRKKKKDSHLSKSKYSYTNKGAETTDDISTHEKMPTVNLGLDANIDLGSSASDLFSRKNIKSEVLCHLTGNEIQPPNSETLKSNSLDRSNSSNDIEPAPLTLTDLSCSLRDVPKSKYKIKESGDELGQGGEVNNGTNQNLKNEGFVGESDLLQRVEHLGKPPGGAGGVKVEEESPDAILKLNGFTQDKVPARSVPTQTCSELLINKGVSGEDLSSVSSGWSSSSCSILSLESLTYPAPIIYHSDPIEHKLYGALPAPTTGHWAGGVPSNTSHCARANSSTTNYWSGANNFTKSHWSEDSAYRSRHEATSESQRVFLKERSELSSPTFEVGSNFESEYDFGLGKNSFEYSCDFSHERRNRQCSFENSLSKDDTTSNYLCNYSLGKKTSARKIETDHSCDYGNNKGKKQSHLAMQILSTTPRADYTKIVTEGKSMYYDHPATRKEQQPTQIKRGVNNERLSTKTPCYSLPNFDRKPCLDRKLDSNSRFPKIHGPKYAQSGLDMPEIFSTNTSNLTGYTDVGTDELKDSNSPSYYKTNMKGAFKSTSTPDYSLSSSSNSLESLGSSLDDLSLELDSSRSWEGTREEWEDEELWGGVGGRVSVEGIGLGVERGELSDEMDGLSGEMDGLSDGGLGMRKSFEGEEIGRWEGMGGIQDRVWKGVRGGRLRSEGGISSEERTDGDVWEGFDREDRAFGEKQHMSVWEEDSCDETNEGHVGENLETQIWDRVNMEERGIWEGMSRINEEWDGLNSERKELWEPITCNSLNHCDQPRQGPNYEEMDIYHKGLSNGQYHGILSTETFNEVEGLGNLSSSSEKLTDDSAPSETLSMRKVEHQDFLHFDVHSSSSSDSDYSVSTHSCIGWGNSPY